MLLGGEVGAGVEWWRGGGGCGVVEGGLPRCDYIIMHSLHKLGVVHGTNVAIDTKIT